MTLVYGASMIDECGLPRKSIDTSGAVTYSRMLFIGPSAAAGPLKGILAVEDAPLVSVDFRKNPNSSIIDSAYTKVMDGNFVKVLSWYDNEWGYSSRCVDLLTYMATKGL